MQSIGHKNNLRKFAGLAAGILVLLAAVFLATRLCSAEAGPAIPRIFKPKGAKLGLGRALRFDPETEQVIGDDEANKLLRDGDRGYRAPFVVPEEV